MNYFTECLTKFRELTDPVREAFGGLETYAVVQEIEDKYKIKLSFLVILVAIGELEEEDIEEYLILKFKLTPSNAQVVKEELVAKVIDPAFEKLINIKPEKSIRVGKEEIINLFTKRVRETLKASPDTIRGLNIVIFKLLNSHEDLEEKIINLLYNNDETLTIARLILAEREVAPTISNWLKDFIKLNGSELFDDLVLAQYLSTSVNTKNLSFEEKELVSKLLKLYRNLAFFPESMDNLALVDWQIIPVDREKEAEFTDVLSEEKPVAKNKPSAQKPSVKVTPKVTVKPSVSKISPSAKIEKVEKFEIKPEIKTEIKTENNSFDELKQTLTQYASDSLEYKAVLQEIGRLKKKKK